MHAVLAEAAEAHEAVVLSLEEAMRTAEAFASAVPLAVLELWALWARAAAWDAALDRALPHVLTRLGRPGTETPGFWTRSGCVVVDKAVIAPCWDALLVMASGLDVDGLDGLADPVANALRIDCAVPLSAASVTHLLTEAPATWATVGDTQKLQISLSQCLKPSSSCPHCLASVGYALSPPDPGNERNQ